MSAMKQPARSKRTRLRTKGRPQGPVLSDAAYGEICEIVGHSFRDRALVNRAFTHPSAIPPGSPGLSSNQRLEFLGDRVLGLVIAERLFLRHRTEREGDLAPRLNRLVNKRACAEAVRHMGLGGYIIMSRYEVEKGGQARDSTLGDLCESIIAALYLDSGLTKARAFIERAFAPQLTAQPSRLKDPKSLLQEWAQAHGHKLPRYKTLARHGPDHAPQFTVEVRVGDVWSETAVEPSKQNAERAAALQLLTRLDPLTDDS